MGRFIAVAGFVEVNIVKFDTGDTVAVCEGSGYTVDLRWSPRGDKLAVVPFERSVPSVFNEVKYGR